MQYKQLSSEQRYTIQKLLEQGESKSRIAAIINVDRSTIYRELKRNTPVKEGVYYSTVADYMSKSRRSKANKISYRMTESIKEEIGQRLREGWSPEQISGRYKLEDKPMVSHETIYTYVYNYPEKDLYKHLRRGGKKRRRRTHTYKKRGVLLNRVSIEQRPPEVDEQIRYGDWEGDTIVGKGHKSYLLTLTERKSNFNLIAPLPSKDAQACAEKIIELLTPYKSFAHTLTLDNGKEFARHELVSKEICQVYFAHPYSSHERGCNENQNGLIRQYFKKGSCFKKLSKQDIQKVQEKLNGRPRKKNNFSTPQELMNILFNSVAVHI